MHSSGSRRIRFGAVAVAVAGLLIAGGVAPAFAEDDESTRFTATTLTPDDSAESDAKSNSGRLATSDEELLERSDGTIVPVMVKVDVDPVASYTGTVVGFEATSPEVTGIPISDGSPAIDAYTAYVAERIAAAQAEATDLISNATVIADYVTAYGGFSMTIPANRAKDLLRLGSVAAVQSNELRQAVATPDPDATTPAPDEATPEPEESATTDEAVEDATTVTSDAAANAELPSTTPATDMDATTFIGADAVWPSLGGRDVAGQGIIVGVIDTGIWPEHPMLTDNDLPTPAGGPWACEFGDGSVGPAFECNDKLIGAYAMLDVYQAGSDPAGADAYCAGAVCSARDAEGHGTHTATTAVGTHVDSAPIFGVERGPVSGVAPGASVIAYRALGPLGGYTGDLVASINQAILDGVDVINYSISGSADPYDATELAFLDAFAAGVTVNSSAGNSGPGASTADHASPWTTTVGASTFDRAFTSALVLASTDGTTFVKQGTTITAGVSDLPVVLASEVPGVEDELCRAPFPEDSVTGQVVLCVRGENGRVEKGYNALQGGAAGMILANPTPQDLQTDNHFLPAIQLEGPNDDVIAFITDHPGVTATWAQGEATVAQGDVMAAFSSRGPIGPWLKPDITAPGVQVLAGNTPTPIDIASGPAGELYQAIAGTSMSAPHAAGVSALVKAAHPDWSPGQIKSALMTSSLQSVVNVDGSDAGVFDRGAGSIRADRAIAPTATISETATAFYASAADPMGHVDLNIPSVNVDPLPGAVSTTRTITNVSGKTQVFRASATADEGLRITLWPRTIAIPAGKSRDITVTLDALGAEDGWHEGQITLTPRSGNPLVVPVAANVGEAQISLAQSCEPDTIKRGATTTCTVTASNFMPVAVDAKINVAANPLLQVRSVTPPAKKKALGATWSGTLGPAIPPAITGIDPTDTSPAGYLPLSLFGINPTAIGDEAIVNFTLPAAFQFGGETYSSIGVVSNGYVVVGGGTAADVRWEMDPDNPIPSPVAPNNVLAPLWTDLNPEEAASGAGVRVGLLSDGVNDFLIVEWDRIPTYSGNATNSMQAWIQLGADEAVWFTYGEDAVADAATSAVVAAENRDGTSGIVLEGDALPQAVDEFVVTTDPPAAGGTVSFDYTLRGLVRGTWSTWASLTSDALRTTPMEQTKVTVQ